MLTGGGTFPWPGGPKSHSTDVKPMSLICLESQWRDLELLKCCAALSECRQSVVIICSAKSDTPAALVCCFSFPTVAATKWRML